MRNFSKSLLALFLLLRIATSVRGEVNAPIASTQQQETKANWSRRIVAPMQSAQTLLKSENLSTAVAAQAEAIIGIDAMIAELTQRQSKCQGGQCIAGKCSKPSAPNPGKSAPSGKAGKSPAKNASPSTNSDVNLSTDLAVAGELVKDLWGELPERQREQILQPLREEFLPKYSSEIEAYFRALADPNRSLKESR